MKIISLNQGKYTIIDDDDLDKVRGFTWRVEVGQRTFYAVSNVSGKSSKRIHHLIIGEPKPGFVVDHINGNGLDNRKINLRFLPHKENILNTKSRYRNASGFFGVCKNPRKGKPWRAFVTVGLGGSNQLFKSLGFHRTREDAAVVRDLWIITNNHSNLRLNVIENKHLFSDLESIKTTPLIGLFI